MYNPEKLSSFDTQDTGRGQTKQKSQHRKLKIWATRTPPKTRGKPRGSRRSNSPCLPQDTHHVTHKVNRCLRPL